VPLVRGWEGRYFEDFHVGDVYRSRSGRTISEADSTQFALLTNNSNQIHFNAHYAARTEFGRPLVESLLTIAIVVGLAVPDTSENGFALGWESIELPAPVFAGDTIYAESEVLETRPSRSRPGWGIVKARQRGIKQDGTVVVVMTRAFMVPTRDGAQRIAHFPEPKR
jgi:acyl dehydratase